MHNELQQHVFAWPGYLVEAASMEYMIIGDIVGWDNQSKSFIRDAS